MTETLGLVKRHEDAALAALEAATGGAPLCRADGSGPRSVKSSEGAAVALAEVRRALGRGPSDRSLQEAEAVVAEVHARWAATAARRESGPAWREYISGGLGALDELEADLARRPVGSEGRLGAADPGGIRLVPAATVTVSAEPTTDRGPAAAWLASTRTRVAAVVLALVWIVVVAVAVGWQWVDQPLWSVFMLAAVGLSSLALATFVPQPGQGWKPSVGCAPCAAAGWVLAVAGPWLAIAAAPLGQRAALGMALAGAAVARRLTEPPTCGTRFGSR